MGIVETLKDVATLVQKTDNIDLVKHVLLLQSQALEMQDEIRTLRDRVKDLAQKLNFAGTLHFNAPLYFAKDDKASVDTQNRQLIDTSKPAIN